MFHKNKNGSTLFGLSNDEKFNCEWAAWANAVAVRELDFHDNIMAKETCHPGDCIPTILAVAQQKKLNGKDLIRGIATSYEIQLRLSMSIALNPNKTGMTRNLITLKKELSSETWNGLRQEFFIKLSEKMMKTNGDLAGQTFATSWKAVKSNKTLVNTLFTKEERSKIDALASTAMRISSKAANYSNSANSLLNGLKGVINMFGPTPVSRGAGSLPIVTQAMSASAKGSMAQSPLAKNPSWMRQWLTNTAGITVGAETVEGTTNALLGNSASSGENK